MRFRIYIIACIFLFSIKANSQQKNILKINVLDCANCTNNLHKILEKDPSIILIIHCDFAMDSNDVVEKFNLQNYKQQITWSGKLYDSISKSITSELIQYYDTKEINRCGLANYKFLRLRNSELPKNICFQELSNNISFSDYKEYLLIKNYVSNQQYVYFKKNNKLLKIEIDSDMINRIYINFLHNPKLLELYKYMMTVSPIFKPKVLWTSPYNDSTVIGVLATYKVNSMDDKDTVFSKMPSIIKLYSSGRTELEFIKDTLTLAYHYLNTDEIHFFNKKIYFPLSYDIESLSKNNLPFKNLVCYQKQKNFYQFDKVLPSTLNDYLITNKVYNNYNLTYFDNGYSLMSLSNYIIDLKTEKKIYLPIKDSVFNNIFINPKSLAINFFIGDFKYNAEEKKFYIKYQDGKNGYYASFKEGSNVFDENIILYDVENRFTYDVKDKCLSWDGKSILYCMKNENCFKYATVSEIQEIAKNYNQK